MSDYTSAAREEIEALHRFFTGWFQGNLPKEALETLETKLAPDFVNVQPAGRLLTKAELLDGIGKGHGHNPDFEIEIHDVVVRWVSPDANTILATYVELQRGARNTTPATNRRLSTVLFDTSNDAWLWLHVHETKLD